MTVSLTLVLVAQFKRAFTARFGWAETVSRLIYFGILYSVFYTVTGDQCVCKYSRRRLLCIGLSFVASHIMHTMSKKEKFRDDRDEVIRNQSGDLLQRQFLVILP